ncbi:iron uptake transporter permease EfeU [Streptacidiphilus carbonis]|uniref:iron uptake transporter permease EfeU n=1 Tax=Streptacidiphilus carbonis TaxID=105422 RepID=UPI0005A87E29|nr:iron uptake transporter permease EfeU [Streptacidiphilus carbonis]
MWDVAFPSFLIGLREGLEAGLVVSILVATLVRFDQRSRLPQVWTGVLAAVGLSLGFGAVLTFTANSLPTTAQEAFGGALSVVAVAFVTLMIFWMRRNARNLSGEIRDKVDAALAVGAGTLVLTSFLAVGREGLETALFIWTTAQTARTSGGPLIGAAVGLVLAGVLCWALYRRVLRINLTKFFTWTGAALVVIAAGVLAYGLRDLQEGGLLPGAHAFAVDLSGSLDATSWYATLLQGVFNLTTRMTWLQVFAYVAYLATVMALFVRGVRAPALAQAPAQAPVSAAVGGSAPPGTASSQTSTAAAALVTAAEAVVTAAEAVVAAAAKATSAATAAADAATAAAAAASAEESPATARTPAPEPPPAPGPEPAVVPTPAVASRPMPPAASGRRPGWLVPTAAVVVPVVVAGVIVGASGGRPAAAATVSVSPTACGQGFTAARPGQQVFQMRNTGKATSEVYLIDPATNAVYGEIEGLAPGTTRALTATLGSGDFAWRCIPTGGTAVTSASVHVTGGSTVSAVLPLAATDLDAPLAAYKAYVTAGLTRLLAQTRKLQTDLRGGNLAAARTDWLTAHLGYASLGAAYGTFADFDAAINGRADGLPGGVADPDFTGFHRLEYGLWHGRSAPSLSAVADKLVTDVTGLQKAFPTQDFDPNDLPLRTHEILENTLQFELTGDTDEGSGSSLATARANLSGTQELLSVLRPLIVRRSPGLLVTVDADIARLAGLLAADRTASGDWTPVQQLDPTTRAALNGATGQLLEDLAPIPDLLEIRKAA